MDRRVVGTVPRAMHVAASPKTLFFCFGLTMAYVVCCLIPNRLLVAAVISKMFLEG